VLDVAVAGDRARLGAISGQIFSDQSAKGRLEPAAAAGDHLPVSSSIALNVFRYLKLVDNLAPDIIRQRLIIEGFYTLDVDEVAIGRYFVQLTSALGLRTYGEPTIFSPSGQGRESNQGYDAFIPLIDSGISLYVWSQRRFLSVISFSCTHFDVERAVEVTRDFFGMTKLVHQEF